MLTVKERFAQIEARRAALELAEVLGQRALSPSSENDAPCSSSQNDGGFSDAMEDAWNGHYNVDDPAQDAAEQQQAPEQAQDGDEKTLQLQRHQPKKV